MLIVSVFELIIQFRATTITLVNGIGRDHYSNFVSVAFVVVVVIIEVTNVVHDRERRGDEP
jgi:hypothetical protein